MIHVCYRGEKKFRAYAKEIKTGDSAMRKRKRETGMKTGGGLPHTSRLIINGAYRRKQQRKIELTWSHAVLKETTIFFLGISLDVDLFKY